MAWEWLAPAAVVTSGAVSYFAARLGSRDNRRAADRATVQRVDQATKEEWDRRFTMALDRTGHADRLQRTIAFTLLGELAQDSRASEQDRQMARRILEAAIADPVAQLEPNVDGVDVVVDDGEAGPEGGPQP